MPIVHCEMLFATLCAVSWAEVNAAIVATRRFERKLNFALRLSPSLWTSERNWRKLWTTLVFQFVSSKLRCEMSNKKKKSVRGKRLTSFSFCLFEMCAQETIGYDTGSLITDSFHARTFSFLNWFFEFSEYWGAQIEQWERIYLQISNFSIITTDLHTFPYIG